MVALLAGIRQHDVVERLDRHFHVANVRFRVNGNEGGGEGFARLQVDEVAGEVAVDVGFGVDKYVVEVGLGHYRGLQLRIGN